MFSLHRRRWFWPLVFALLAAGFTVQVARFYHPVYGFTSLIQLDSSSEAAMLPELHERPVYVHRATGGYDGQYYAQLACRPTLRDPALLQAIDNLGYRARRCLASWTAWLLAFGNPTRALDIYTLINPVCWLALAALLLFVFPPRSLHDFIAWSGLLCSAGALASVRLALTDLPALTLILAAAVLYQRQRTSGAVGLLAAAILARETSLLTFPAFCGETRKSTALRAAACVAPLALWYAYIRFTLGAGSDGWDNLTWPGISFLAKWRFCLGDLGNKKYPLLAWTSLLSMIGITVQAGWLIVRPAWKNIWWRLGIGHVGLMLMLGWAPWEGYPGAATRVLLPLQLAFNALAPRTRTGLFWLILGNLSFASGLLFIFDVPHERDELAAARIEEAAYVAYLGPGFYGAEQHGAHRWCWADREAVLRMQVWHASTPVRVEFALHAFAPPRRVTIFQGQHVLWSGRLERADVPVVIETLGFAADGTTELRFVSDEPGVKENSSALARTIAFSISDFRFGP